MGITYLDTSSNDQVKDTSAAPLRKLESLHRARSYSFPFDNRTNNTTVIIRDSVRPGSKNMVDKAVNTEEGLEHEKENVRPLRTDELSRVPADLRDEYKSYRDRLPSKMRMKHDLILSNISQRRTLATGQATSERMSLNVAEQRRVEAVNEHKDQPFTPKELAHAHTDVPAAYVTTMQSNMQIILLAAEQGHIVLQSKPSAPSTASEPGPPERAATTENRPSPPRDKFSKAETQERQPGPQPSKRPLEKEVSESTRPSKRRRMQDQIAALQGPLRRSTRARKPTKRG